MKQQTVKLTPEALEAMQAFQTSDLALMYSDTLDAIAEYITLVDDPDLDAMKQLHWLRTIVMIRKDIQAVAEAAE